MEYYVGRTTDDGKRCRADTQWPKDEEKGGEEENVTKEGVLDEERRGLPSEHGKSRNADQRMQTRTANGYYLYGMCQVSNQNPTRNEG